MLSYEARRFVEAGLAVTFTNDAGGEHLDNGMFIRYGNWSTRVGPNGVRLQNATLYDEHGKFVAAYDASSDEVYQ